MSNEEILLKMLIHKKLDEYLKRNPERFTKAEKDALAGKVQAWLETDEKWILDEVEDFLVWAGIYKHKSREDAFKDYIVSKYNVKQYKNVLDVGAGRVCKTSTALGNSGYNVTAIDPSIRLEPKELKERKIKAIYKKPFVCDEYSSGNGTNIARYDLIVGLEPCEATEHIIRQSLKYDKPFDVTLCYQEHSALDGTKFKTPEEWYEHLAKVSREVSIEKVGSMYHAKNKGIEMM